MTNVIPLKTEICPWNNSRPDHKFMNEVALGFTISENKLTLREDNLSNIEKTHNGHIYRVPRLLYCTGTSSNRQLSTKRL